MFFSYKKLLLLLKKTSIFDLLTLKLSFCKLTI
jgi:hypothetical protein